ncbi:dihydrofolate reductase family protein [Streptosporangium sp. CA-135522]|uniref:dihydrofolate reductase family protein n=1 Tax=Streptosporangium sp. CA-135522 TaxID=3240072 RepID=UPI003D90416F
MSRKLTVGQFISLNGVVEAPEEWNFPYFNDEMGAAYGEMMAEADTLLLGRVTYESFAAVWPEQNDEMADQLNGIRKLVASTTLKEAGWQNSAVIDGDVVTAVKELKEQPGKNITVTGSITLTQTLLRAGLVDEMRLLVHPIVVGTGRRLFPDGPTQVPLVLTRSVTFDTGVLDLTYQPA